MLKRNKGLAILVLIVGACAAFWVMKIAQNITMPQIEYSEGEMMWNSHLFGTGQWSWAWGSSPPYNVAWYPPVFFLMIGQLYNWFGESILLGRLFVLGSFLVCLMLCYLIIRHVTDKKWMSLIGALFPLMQLILSGTSFWFKVDIPAMMFEVAGIYVALKYWRTKAMYLSIVFFALAFYTKQTAIAGAVAVFISLLLQNRREGFKFGSGCVSVVGVIFAGATVATHGEFFRQLVLYERTTPVFRDFQTAFSFWAAAYLPLVPIAFLAILFIIKNDRHVLAWFVAVSFVLNTIFVIRPGAGQNYLFEVMFATCIAAGAILPNALRLRRVVDLVPFGITIMLLVGNQYIISYPDAAYPQRYQQVEAYIQDTNYPILTENYAVVLDAGKVPYCDPFVFYQLSHLGYFNETVILNDLLLNKIKYVVTVDTIPESLQRLSLPIQNVVLANYHLALSLPGGPYGLFVYEANNK